MKSYSLIFGLIDFILRPRFSASEFFGRFSPLFGDPADFEKFMGDFLEKI